MPKRFLIVDDNQTARRIICEIVASRPDWTVSGEAADGMAALELAISERPDLIILDVQMPRLNGIAAGLQILQAWPEALILLISFHDPKLIIPEIKGTKIRGFVSKSSIGRDLLDAIEAVFAGKFYFDDPPAFLGGPHETPGRFEVEN